MREQAARVRQEPNAVVTESPRAAIDAGSPDRGVDGGLLGCPMVSPPSQARAIVARTTVTAVIHRRGIWRSTSALSFLPLYRRWIPFLWTKCDGLTTVCGEPVGGEQPGANHVMAG